MSVTPVYCSLIEIQPLDDCELNPAEIAGAAVRCYIPAASEELAIQLLKTKLRDMKMRIVEMEWCVDYDNTEWENSDNDDEYEFVAYARDTGDVVFGSFHTWGRDAPAE